MTSPIRISAASLLAAGLLAGCGSSAQLAVEDGQGPQPQLPAPSKSLIPTLNIAPAVGWKDGAKPTPAAGLNVTALATGLQHPRWVYTLPNGDVLVAESEAPAKPDDAKGIRGWVQKKVMKRAGSGAAPSANRITLLRDADGDGVAEVKSVFVQGLNSPIGMALAGDTLYVADTDAVMAFPYKDGDLKVDGPVRKLTDLPAGTINHHWTKSLIASADGSKLYVGIGSNSNVAENGLDAEKDRARVWEIDTKTGEHTVYGSGLRNPVGLAWEPSTQALWVAVNERDELGSDLVPDYITSIKPGAFYGWPFSYYGQHVDARAQPQDAALVASAIPPDYAVGPHTASLGLSSSKGETLGASYEDGMFVGQHGSWNRKPRSGYKVIFVPFKDGRPSGKPVDVLTGFLTADGDAQGRPVGVTLDRKGALLVADDVGNTVWRVSGKDTATQTATVAP